MVTNPPSLSMVCRSLSVLVPPSISAGQAVGMAGTPGKACPQVIRLFNSAVNVCLVYGIDETSTRELEVWCEGFGGRQEEGGGVEGEGQEGREGGES